MWALLAARLPSRFIFLQNYLLKSRFRIFRGLPQTFSTRSECESPVGLLLTLNNLIGSVQSDVFHLYSLSEENIYGSALINYFITGAARLGIEDSYPRGVEE